jgi:hypothetical protein
VESTKEAKMRLSPNAALMASACVIVGLIVMAAGRTGEARADLVSNTSSLTALTVEAQIEDVLLVIDSRSEHMLAYKVVNQNSLELFKSYSLPRMFTDARNRAAGRIK